MFLEKISLGCVWSRQPGYCLLYYRRNPLVTWTPFL